MNPTVRSAITGSSNDCAPLPEVLPFRPFRLHKQEREPCRGSLSCLALCFRSSAAKRGEGFFAVRFQFGWLLMPSCAETSPSCVSTMRSSS